MTCIHRREGQLLLLSGGFLTINILSLMLTRGEVRAVLWWLLWIGCAALGHAALRRLPNRDPVLFPVAMLLAGWGLVVIGRTAPEFAARQPIWLLASVVAFALLAAAPRDLKWLREHLWSWVGVGFVLLALTIIVGRNPSGVGPRLWLGIFDAYFQPSEALKVILIIFLAGEFTAHSRAIRRFALTIAIWLACMLGFVIQRDFGAAALFYLVLLIMLYLATGSRWLVVGGLFGLLIAAVIAYDRFEVVRTRIDIWWNPFLDPNDRAFQIVQSLLAFSSGGLFGQGLGQGSPTYVPVTHSDFALAAIGEEYGLFGVIAVITLFGVLIGRGLRTARRLQAVGGDPFAVYLCSGLCAMLSVQTLLIAGGVLKLIPLTGVTLPFVSYGGSSLLISFITLGLLILLSNTAGGNTVVTITKERTQALLPVIHAYHHRAFSRAVTVALVVVVLCAAYWSLPPNAAALTALNFNPRLVEQERAIMRGAILDRHGIVLVESVQVDVSRSGQAVTVRRYARIEVASALGYYSLRYGLGGVERAYDAELRGTESAFEVMLHVPRQGRSLEVTLDADMQRRISRAFGTGRGAAVVLDAYTGAIRVLVSAPGFNPNTLDDQYLSLVRNPGAPLFNRALSASYQPGNVLRPLIWAVLNKSADDDPYMLYNTITEPQRRMILDVMVSAHVFTPTTLERYPFAAALPIPVSLSDDDLAGQGQLTITPLTMATIMAAVANGGSLVTPHLIESQYVPLPSARAFSESAASMIRANMTRTAVGYYYVATAQTGLGENAWLIGSVITAAGETLIIAAVVESAGTTSARSIFTALESNE